MKSNGLDGKLLLIAGYLAMVLTGVQQAAAAEKNPLLEPWAGPYHGVPAFERYAAQQFAPALEAAMAEQLAEVDRIAGNAGAPSFENTIAALERAGRTFTRVSTIYGIYSSNLSTPAFQAVEQSMEPKLAEFQDRITQNEPLFKRIAAVYETRERSALTPEQQRLAWLYYTNFVRSGAKLDRASKRRLSEINQKLATLFTTFSQHVLADENDYVTVIEKREDLAGLPDSEISAAAATANERGLAGKWAIANTRSAMEPFLTYSGRRDLREKVWRTYSSRCDHGDAKDNKRTSPRSSSCAPSAPSSSATGRMRTGGRGPDGTHARARDGADGGGLETGRGPRRRGGGRHAGGRRPGRRRDPDRAVGLPLLRREGAQGEVRHRRERGEALPAARQAARGHVLGGGPAVRPAVLAGRVPLRSPTRTCVCSR